MAGMLLAVTVHEHPMALVAHVTVGVGPVPGMKFIWMLACTIAHDWPFRHDVGMPRSSTALSLKLVVEYMLFAWKVTEPLMVSFRLNVDDGHAIARGFMNPLTHPLVKFHVPTTLPPHAVNDEQSGPPPVVLPEQPDTITHATSAKTSPLSRMTPLFPAGPTVHGQSSLGATVSLPRS
jgi:hypothetical protein